MRKGNRILTENDVKHIETLLSKGMTSKSVAEILGVSQTSVSRVRTGTHYLQHKAKETECTVAAEQEEKNTTVDVDETGASVASLLNDVVRNQRTIIALLRAMLTD